MSAALHQFRENSNTKENREIKLTDESVLGALSAAILVVDKALSIHYANGAAEQLFQSSATALSGVSLTDILPPQSPISSLVEKVVETGTTASAYEVILDTPKTGSRTMTVHVASMIDATGWAVVSLLEQTRAQKIGQQLENRNSARSVTAMASLLAHEVKNPLSGIRGAAQLLGQKADEEDRILTQLICDEADRIVALVNRMEVFSDDRPLERCPINIHVVLERVRRLAENGFAKRVKFNERYDPSLPAVAGNIDQLVQVFLNLVKNAAESVPLEGGEIHLSTAFKPGVRVELQGRAERVQLPLVVTVQDNGPGIPEDLWPNLFDPFVTTKPKGSGLGLALVAKIINDHGGVIEFDSQETRTTFRVMLPITTITDSST
ncbi:MAG: two-component sensor histidine kinase [Candidatus Marinimicrobia bacterium]|nr:two-component sensor histidine kinase [Candidatus Neomarinimicrobiota bacterium]